MTSAQHAAWIRRGSPWRLARPLLALRDRLRGYGYTVYDIGNPSHLDAQPPEHHCPYSEVNWPDYQGRAMPDVVTADDIMPPPAGSGLPSLQALGAQIFADKQAGDPEAAWIVDMNWGPVDNNHAVRDTWRPGHVRGSSGDTGHIHLSCRSDCIDSAAGDTYDPVARLRGLSEGDDMTPEQEALLANVERLLTAMASRLLPAAGPGESTDRERIKLVQPWFNGPAELPNPIDWLEHRLDGLGAGLKEVAQAVEQLRIVAQAGGTDPAVLAQAAFEGAQRAERE